MENDTSVWGDAPDPILLCVFKYLDPNDLLLSALVCRTWCRISRDDLLWKHLFYRNFHLNPSIPRMPGAESWRSEYRRLKTDVPLVLTQSIEAHSHQVLHVSFSHNGTMFATTSKDGTVMVWDSTYPCKIKFRYDMKMFSWKYTQFSQFNESDTLLLVSGIHFGSPHNTSGEIAVFSVQNEFLLQCRVVNKPYDVFGCWIGEQHLISGELHWLAHLTSSSILWINKAFQEPESEHTPIIAPLYKFYNANASSVRTVMVADCKWNPEINPKENNSYFDNLTDDMHVEDQLSIVYKQEYRKNEEKNVEAQQDESCSESESMTSNSTASSRDDELRNKLFIFTRGEDTYTPHQIGFKRISWVHFPKRLSPGPSIKERIAARERERERERDLVDGPDWEDFESVKDKFDFPDKVIDLHGHIIGMALSPDHRYLYVNSRPWPEGYEIENPLTPPPIASRININVIDLSTLTRVGNMFRAHRAYTKNSDCFFIFLDVYEQFVASGAEDSAAYIWERHYGTCLVRLPHADVVNAVAFNPMDPHMCITASDDYSIKVWRSRASVRRLGIGGRQQMEGMQLHTARPCLICENQS